MRNGCASYRSKVVTLACLKWIIIERGMIKTTEEFFENAMTLILQSCGRFTHCLIHMKQWPFSKNFDQNFVNSSQTFTHCLIHMKWWPFSKDV